MGIDHLSINDYEFIDFQFESLFAFGSNLNPEQIKVVLQQNQVVGDVTLPRSAIRQPGDEPFFRYRDLDQWRLLPGNVLSVVLETTLLDKSLHQELLIARVEAAPDGYVTKGSDLFRDIGRPRGKVLWYGRLDLDQRGECPTLPRVTSTRLAFIYPEEGQTLDYGSCYAYIFDVTQIADAASYRFALIQNKTVVGREVSWWPGYRLQPFGIGHDNIQPGDLTINVEALSDKQKVLQAVSRTVSLVSQPCPVPSRSPSVVLDPTQSAR